MNKSAASTAGKTYAGLDVSLKETAVCIVDDAGRADRPASCCSRWSVSSTCRGQRLIMEMLDTTLQQARP